MNIRKRAKGKKEEIRMIHLDQIDDFPDHPYHVVMDDDMEQLIQSIRMNGLFNPIVVRRKENGRYELISGHRRRRACEELEMKEIKAIVVEMTWDEAVIAMVDSNLHRTHVRISEMAFAYKMKMEAQKRRENRTEPEPCPVDKDPRERLTASRIGEERGDSAEQVYRFVRLTRLKRELLDLVDSKSISFRAAVELSNLIESEQDILIEEIEAHGVMPSLKCSHDLKVLSWNNEFSREAVKEALVGGRQRRMEMIRIPYRQARKFIPREIQKDDIPVFILKILRRYRQELENGSGIPEKPE